MPRKPEEESISLVDLLQMASSDLSQKSVRPNMHMYKPHDKQKFLHCSYAKEKLFIGGNRSGKTVWNVMECIWWLTKKHPFRPDVNAIVEPIRGRLVCVSFIDGLDKIILPYFKQFLPSSELINGNWEDSYSRQSRTLTLANGSFIEFMSYDQELEKFAGTSRHFCSFDEEPPQAVYIECKMRLMDTGGSYWISMTPVEGMTWIYFDLYEPHRRGENTDLQILEINTEENPAIAKSFLNSMITVTLCCLWPMVINTAVGVASLSEDLRNVSRVLRLSALAHVRKIVIPASIPMIFTGMRLSLGIAWMVLIAAEMLAQNPGLGKFVWDEFQNGSSDSLSRIMVAVITIGLIGFLLDRCMLQIQRMVSWDKASASR